ncbi:hypothetical protein VTJ04DRAFT_8424 [Mycothermus thermophilus]|uniref:uncharacterized protein n=1 Tax=Humicola insolens TaxID=85995 RepID=UPI0037434AD6
MKSFTQLIATMVVANNLVLAQSFSDSYENSATTYTITESLSETGVLTGCPTVTATRELCTTCPVPLCLGLVTLTQSCGCPATAPTVYLDFPCASGCSGIHCPTSYSIVTASDCAEDGPGATTTPIPSTTPPTESTATSAPTSTTSNTLTISTNAAARIGSPFRWLW